MDSIGGAAWRRSIKCDTSACVEWREIGQHVEVRNSTGPDGPVLRFNREEWAVFIEGLVADAQLPR
jgi:hypothetical protein